MENEIEVINIKAIIKKIFQNRKAYYLPLGIVFVLSCIYIFSLPRYYSTEAKLAPELEGNMMSGSLGTIASAFGFDFGDMQTSDAITPLLYPDLLEDNAFVANLFNVRISTADGSLNTTYYDYLKNHQKKPWWGGFTSWLRNLLTFKKESSSNGGGQFDPYQFSKKDDAIAEKIRGNIKLSIDKKTGVITINAQDQDPRVCRCISDSVILGLQEFITAYRTNKARRDLDFYTALADSAKIEFENASRKYGSFTDANQGVILESLITRRNNLQRDVDLKYTTYSSLVSQREVAKGKLQERTPAFTLLKGAATPILPAGPKRVRFVMAMMVLSFIVVSAWIIRKDIHLKF